MTSFISIFYNTTSTFKKLNNEFEDKLQKRNTVIFCLSGVITAFRSFVKVADDEVGFFPNLILLSLGALLGYFLSRFIFTQLLYIIGKRLKGKAEFIDVQVILAYSMIPGIIVIPANMFLRAYFSDVYFKYNIWIGQNCLTIISLVLSIKILVQGLKVYNDYSTTRALLNASVLYIVPLLISGVFYLPFILQKYTGL